MTPDQRARVEDVRVERIDVTTGQPITGEDWAAFDWVDVTTRDRPPGQRFYVRARPRAATPGGTTMSDQGWICARIGGAGSVVAHFAGPSAHDSDGSRDDA